MSDLKTVTVAHASFWYTKGDYYAVALRGDEIQVGPEDYERGQVHGAFAAKGETVEPVTPAQEPATPNPIDLTDTVDKIVEAVGADKALASQVIEQENAAEKPRSTLIERLTAVVTANPA